MCVCVLSLRIIRRDYISFSVEQFESRWLRSRYTRSAREESFVKGARDSDFIVASSLAMRDRRSELSSVVVV